MKNSERRRVCLIVLFGILLVPQVVAQTNIWTGTVSTDWNNPVNWSPQQVPTSGDHAVISSNSVAVPSDAVFAVMDWSGGSIYGSLTVRSNASLNVSGNGQKYLYGVLTNQGTVQWSAGNLDLYSDGVNNFGAVYNEPGSVFEIQCDQILGAYLLNSYGYPSPGVGFFVNAGTLRKSGGTNTTYWYAPLTNNGTIEVQSGTLNFNSWWAYGVGGYWSGPSGNITTSVAGNAPARDYGQIQFNSPFNLDGAFSVSFRNGFRPNPGDTFQVLSYPSAAGMFDCMSLDLGAGLILQPQFGSHILSLITTTYPTNSAEPQLLIARTPNGVFLSWPLGFPDWSLESTTNLDSPVWNPVPSTCGNQTFVPATVPVQYFRLKRN